MVVIILLLSALFAGLATFPAAAQPSFSAQASNIKRIIFRDDDIAPYVQLGTLKAVNQVHIDKNVPVTLGVIPHPELGVSGNQLLADTNARNYLQSLATKPLFEFAQHGYTHADSSVNTVGASSSRMFGATPYQERLVGAGYSEFRGRSYAEQYNTIKQGRDDIKNALGVTPTTFIPPFNTGDTNTLKACSALGFTLYSTGYADFGVTEATMEGIRVQAVSLELGWSTTSEWQTGMAALTSNTDAALNSAPPGTGLAVMYHFWYFQNSDGSPDPIRIALFGQYIDHLKSRGDVQFTTLGGQLASRTGPAVCAQDANSLDVFVQGTDHALWHRRYQSGSGWSAWQSLGGYLTSSPAATSQTRGVIDVFVRGGDGALWQKTTTNGGTTWFSWTSRGGQIASDTGPAACSWDPGRLDVFIKGTNGALYHKWYAGKWSGWESLGGKLTSSPAAVSWSSGRIDVTIRGGDGALWHKFYLNGWSGWGSLGGQVASGTGPAVCSWSANRFDVFIKGTNGALYHKWYAGKWSGWENLGGYLTSSPATTASGGNRIDVFVRGGDSRFWWKWYVPGGWSRWLSIGGS